MDGRLWAEQDPERLLGKSKSIREKRSTHLLIPFSQFCYLSNRFCFFLFPAFISDFAPISRSTINPRAQNEFQMLFSYNFRFMFHFLVIGFCRTTLNSANELNRVPFSLLLCSLFISKCYVFFYSSFFEFPLTCSICSCEPNTGIRFLTI